MNTHQSITVVMPMGGLGSRFVKEGFTDPKPLIRVDGIAMFQKALSSFAQLDVPKKLVCVVRQEHVDEYGIDKLIVEHEPTATVVVIPVVTRGAVETTLAAREYIDREAPLIVMDCDLYIQSKAYDRMMQQAVQHPENPGFDGLLATHTSSDPRYSFALADETGKVIQTAEKVAISNNALAGTYGFSRGSLFLDAADALMKLPVAEEVSDEEHLVTKVWKEYYISYLYNIMLAQGKEVRIAQIDTYASFGTPEELKAYEEANPQ